MEYNKSSSVELEYWKVLVCGQRDATRIYTHLKLCEKKISQKNKQTVKYICRNQRKPACLTKNFQGRAAHIFCPPLLEAKYLLMI